MDAPPSHPIGTGLRPVRAGLVLVTGSDPDAQMRPFHKGYTAPWAEPLGDADVFADAFYALAYFADDSARQSSEDMARYFDEAGRAAFHGEVLPAERRRALLVAAVELQPEVMLRFDADLDQVVRIRTDTPQGRWRVAWQPGTAPLVMGHQSWSTWAGLAGEIDWERTGAFASVLHEGAWVDATACGHPGPPDSAAARYTDPVAWKEQAAQARAVYLQRWDAILADLAADCPITALEIH